MLRRIISCRVGIVRNVQRPFLGVRVPQRDNGGRVWLVKFAESQSALTEEKEAQAQRPNRQYYGERYYTITV